MQGVFKLLAVWNCLKKKNHMAFLSWIMLANTYILRFLIVNDLIILTTVHSICSCSTYYYHKYGYWSMAFLGSIAIIWETLSVFLNSQLCRLVLRRSLIWSVKAIQEKWLYTIGYTEDRIHSGWCMVITELHTAKCDLLLLYAKSEDRNKLLLLYIVQKMVQFCKLEITLNILHAIW